VVIAVVDYGMGNIRSVEKGFLKVGTSVRVTADPRVVADARAVVLPGVGAFRDCMKNLEDRRLLDAVIRGIRAGKPYLGICLGLQILFTESEEFGACRGMDILPGRVVRFRFPREADLKIPHMGWNTVNLRRRPPLFDDIPDGSHFYFVHSYYVLPDEEGVTAGVTDYGFPFTSMIWKDNVFATQFHPEKSQERGLRILAGFSRFVQEERLP